MCSLVYIPLVSASRHLIRFANYLQWTRPKFALKMVYLYRLSVPCHVLKLTLNLFSGNKECIIISIIFYFIFIIILLILLLYLLLLL